MQIKRRTIFHLTLALCFVIAIEVAQAWVIPALMWTGRFLAGPITSTVMWLGRSAAANPTMARALEWSIVGHGAVIGAVWFGKPDQTNTTPIEAKLVIAPKKDQQTVNPDPTKFDDTPSDSDKLQPKPKSAYPAAESTTTLTSTYPAIIQSLGGAGSTGWYQYNAKNDIRYLVVAAPQNNCAAPELNSVPAGYDSKAWCGGVTIGGTSASYAVYADIKERCTSSPGYVLTNGECVLQDASVVQKPPSTVSCEVIRGSDNTWYVDPKNPECAALSASISQSSDKKKLTVDNKNGESVTVTENDDGTRNYDFQSGDNWRSIKTGAYDASLNGRPITSITDGTGSNPSGTAGNSGTGTTGSSGTGSGGSCGGSGQPACSIDDSGFDGKSTDGEGLVGKVDAHDESIKDKFSGISASDKHGMDWSWTPSIPRVACTPFEFGTGGRTMSIDMCNTFSVIRQALGWLLYIFMAWGLFDLLMSGTTSKGRK